MDSNGIMTEIRSHLSSGKSSGEVIRLGFKPPTVYKVQRQLNRRSQGDGRVSAPGNAQPSATVDNKPRSELEAENVRLRQEVENLEGELECLVDADAELAAQVQTLLERVKALEAEADAAGQLRQRVRELEGHLGHATEIHLESGVQVLDALAKLTQVAFKRGLRYSDLRASLAESYVSMSPDFMKADGEAAMDLPLTFKVNVS